MQDETTPWWKPFARRREHNTSPAAEQRQRVEAAVQDLRELLRSERGRLRPDTWATADLVTRRTEDLLPHWGALAEQRAAETLTVEDIVCRDLPRRLEAFLAVPDSQKPALASELAEQLSSVEQDHLRACRRLHAVSRIRLESLRELRGDG